jgi:hypothetical protein
MSLQGNSRGPLSAALAVDINTLGDTFVPLNIGTFVPRNISVTNASVDMELSDAAIAVYSAADAGGIAITDAETLAALTDPTQIFDLTLISTSVITPTASPTEASVYGIYINVSVGHGNPATVDVYIFGDSIT